VLMFCRERCYIVLPTAAPPASYLLAMSLPPLVGHLEQRRRIAAAHQGGRLPQVVLLTGPKGVGRQRFALWVAQLLFCERPAEEPCGSCRACRLVLGLRHPDLHWFVPVPRPKGDADRQVEEVEELLAAVMAERRAHPLYGPVDGMAAHGMGSVRLLLRRSALTPVEQSQKVVILGDAERLVVQESSPDAANALLKLLEEPPADTRILLTAVEARRLLPTVRSRAVPLRLGRLSEADVASVLGRPAPEAEGAPGAVVGSASDSAFAAAAGFLEAVAAGPAERLERALRQPPFSARGEFTSLLDALAETLSDAARNANGVTPRRPLPAALRTARDPVGALQRVAAAREVAAGNVNPQLLLAALAEDLAEVL
jgi:DNA polymerase-3 subunit delta'